MTLSRVVDPGRGTARRAAVAIRRGVDVTWCAASLILAQLYVASEAGVTLNQQALSTSFLVALVPVVVLLSFTYGRLRAWMAWSLVAAASVAALADLLYFRFFGDVMSTPALFAWGQAGQVSGSAWSLVVPRDSWIPANLVLAALGAFAVSEKSQVRARRVICAIVVLLIVVPATLVVARDADHPDSQFRNVDEVGRIGLFGYHVHDAWRRANDLGKFALSERELQETRRWFAERAPLRAGSGRWFGAARGRNLIVVQVESLQQLVLDFRINGREVTPNLNRWKKDALWFSNVTDQTSEGRTSDGEFTSLVSLLPLDHGAVAFRHPGNRYLGLPRVLGDRGYTTMSAVAFDGGFWNRRVVHPQYGFDRQLFDRDFAAGEQIGWGLNDRDFLAQAVPKLAALPKPFGAWLITLSLHHPYSDFPEQHKELDVRPWDRNPFGNYLHAMHFFDRAFGEFVAALEKQGLLRDSVLVVLGDHDAGIERDDRLLREIGVLPYLLGFWLSDEVPFVIGVPGNGDAHGESAIRAGQTDVAPTLLGLLGIDAAPYPYVGRNLLGNPGNDPVVRPYGNWVDATRFFAVRTSEREAERCFDVPAHREIDIESCAAGRALALQQIEMSRRVVRYDLHEDLLVDPSSANLDDELP
jgi:phosphoglycerol transferase MdoB-like AlkP superfamily enzyme